MTYSAINSALPSGQADQELVSVELWNKMDFRNVGNSADASKNLKITSRRNIV